jgi:hypothetical protein
MTTMERTTTTCTAETTTSIQKDNNEDRASPTSVVATDCNNFETSALLLERNHVAIENDSWETLEPGVVFPVPTTNTHSVCFPAVDNMDATVTPTNTNTINTHGCDNERNSNELRAGSTEGDTVETGVLEATNFFTAVDPTAVSTDDESSTNTATPPVCFAVAKAAVSTTKSNNNNRDKEDGEQEDSRAEPSAAEHLLVVSSKETLLEQAIAKNKQLEEKLASANNQRAKMIANMKCKKTLLEQAQTKIAQLAMEHKAAQDSAKSLTAENESLRSGLAKVAAARDELKHKLRVKNEILRDARAEQADLERRLRGAEQNRALTLDLLSQYRKLAAHTGYYKWGKPIRLLEAAMQEATDSTVAGAGEN